MRSFKPLLPLLLSVPLSAVPAAAQVVESVGVRALGMGGAFVAVADDGTATYWNPAGLATGPTLDVCGSYATGDVAGGPGEGGERRGDTAARSFCLAVPAIGLSYYNLRVTSAFPSGSSTGADPGDRQDLRPREVGVSSLAVGQFGLTLLQTLAPGITAGATVKAVRGRFAIGALPPGSSPGDALERGRQLDAGPKTVVDADAALMAVAGRVRLGLVVRNLREPRFEAPGGQEVTLQRQARLGVAVTPRDNAAFYVADPAGLIVSLDVDLTRTPTPLGERRNVAVGVERWFAGRRVGVRAGARASTVDEARPVGTAGVSLGLVRGVFVEAALVRGHHDGDRGWTVGMRAGL
jgi:hypothetical protein